MTEHSWQRACAKPLSAPRMYCVLIQSLPGAVVAMIGAAVAANYPKLWWFDPVRMPALDTAACRARLDTSPGILLALLTLSNAAESQLPPAGAGNCHQSVYCSLLDPHIQGAGKSSENCSALPCSSSMLQHCMTFVSASDGGMYCCHCSAPQGC